jgi:dGTPase
MEIELDILKEIDKNSKNRENLLSEYATKNSESIRRKNIKQETPEVRPPFFRDADRIIHSKAYARYIDKTQVFFLVNNDHITHRVLHVQLVSKISRVIGRALGLNEDLLEAISLGHDIGHVPYGHLGESILSELCTNNGLPKFKHNIQSVQFLDTIEDKDLTMQVLDGILCHNGEVLKEKLKPDKNLEWDSYNTKIQLIQKDADPDPMTLEGCVVRFADVIAYLGRDLVDAMEVNLIPKDLPDFPEDCKEILGYELGKDINWLIIDTLIKDIINTSYGKNEISFSPEIQRCVKICKDYNYANIYKNKRLQKETGKIEQMYELMFSRYLKDLEFGNNESLIYRDMKTPEGVSKEYLNNASNAEIVRDFLAGMTDRYFEHAFNEITIPKIVDTCYQ